MADETGSVEGVRQGPPEAGWYVDALGEYRWWDGAAWTVHTLAVPPEAPAAPEAVPAEAVTPAEPVAPAEPVEPGDAPPDRPGDAPPDQTSNPAEPAVMSPATSVLSALEPVAPSQTPPAPPSRPSSPPGRARVYATAGAVLVLVAAVVAVVVLRQRSDDSTITTSSPTTTPSSTPTPTSSPSTTPTEPTSAAPLEPGPSAVASDLLTKTFAHDCSLLTDMTAGFRAEKNFTAARCRRDASFFGATGPLECIVTTSREQVRGTDATVRFGVTGPSGCTGRGTVGLVHRKPGWLVASLTH